MPSIISLRHPSNGDACHRFRCDAVGHGLSGVVCDSVADAIARALERAHEEDTIFIGGSTFIVADALPLFMK